MDYFLDAVMSIILWPWSWLKKRNENARLGVSEMERDDERFWKKATFVGVTIILVTALIIGLCVLWKAR